MAHSISRFYIRKSQSKGIYLNIIRTTPLNWHFHRFLFSAGSRSSSIKSSKSMNFFPREKNFDFGSRVGQVPTDLEIQAFESIWAQVARFVHWFKMGHQPQLGNLESTHSSQVCAIPHTWIDCTLSSFANRRYIWPFSMNKSWTGIKIRLFYTYI